jgi:hypothetical protein
MPTRNGGLAANGPRSGRVRARSGGQSAALRVAAASGSGVPAAAPGLAPRSPGGKRCALRCTRGKGGWPGCDESGDRKREPGRIPSALGGPQGAGRNSAAACRAQALQASRTGPPPSPSCPPDGLASRGARQGEGKEGASPGQRPEISSLRQVPDSARRRAPCRQRESSSGSGAPWRPRSHAGTARRGA